MAYLPLRRALALALRLLPSSSLTSERTIRCAGFPPASHATLRGAPDYADLFEELLLLRVELDGQRTECPFRKIYKRTSLPKMITGN
jgi:hypothetical protein